MGQIGLRQAPEGTNSVPQEISTSPRELSIGEQRAASEQKQKENLRANFAKENDFFPNLALKLDKKRLAEIGNSVVQGYLTDIGSRSEWEEHQKKTVKLYAMHRDAKNFPWEDCSNVSLPMLAMACAQYQARAFEELIPAKGIVKELPFLQNEDNADIAKRKSKWMNYQLMVKDKIYKKSMDASLLKQGISGDVIRKSYYDPMKGAVVTDYISTTDFVINYNTRWLVDSERYTQRVWMSENDLRIRMQNGSYINHKDVFGKESIPTDSVKTQHLENVGLIATTDNDDEINIKLVLEQHVLMDLSGKGGIKEPYIITVDFNQEKVLRIVSRKHPFTGEKLDFFTDYPMLPNPDGFYGYGFGLFLEGLNESLNTIVNQLVDAGTLQNLSTGFVLKGKGMKRGEISLAMGEFTEIDPGGNDDIRKIISQFNFGPPSPVLFAMLGVLQQYSDRFTTVTEQQTGGAQKSDTTATGIAILVEQGLKFFSAIHRRNHIALQQELEKIEKLYSLYLDVEEYFNIVIDPRDLTNPQSGETIPKETILAMLREDFNTTNQIVPISNPNIISKQEVTAKAQFVYEATVNSPVTNQNLMAIWEAQKNLYEALDISEADIQRFLPQPAAEEPLDLPQEEENQMFINDQYVEPLEQQNHKEHLQVIQEFEQLPILEDMTATGKKFLDQHKRAHLGFWYIIQKGSEIQAKSGAA